MAALAALLMIPLQATAASADSPGNIASYFEHVLNGMYQGQYLAMGIIGLLMGAGLIGIATALRSGPSRHWAAVAVPVLTIGAAMVFVTGIIAGVGLPPVVEAWDDAGRDASTYATAVGVWWIVRSGFIGFVFTLLGAGIAALGLAVAKGATLPIWLGWSAVGIGTAGMLIAILLAIQGPGVPLEGTAFPIVAMLATLWIIVAGILSWRKGGQLREPV